jgi:CRISPR/Cas system-associated exonuclease Cas4 (RecB family)
MSSSDVHNYFLDELVNRLKEINEDKKQIKWIMKDGIWLKEDSYRRNKLCDLLLAYYDGTGVPVELKGSKKKRQTAITQLEYGKVMLEDVFGLKVNYGKFVIYRSGDYECERIDWLL